MQASAFACRGCGCLSLMPWLLPTIKYEKRQSQYHLYQHCGFLHLIMQRRRLQRECGAKSRARQQRRPMRGTRRRCEFKDIIPLALYRLYQLCFIFAFDLAVLAIVVHDQYADTAYDATRSTPKLRRLDEDPYDVRAVSGTDCGCTDYHDQELNAMKVVELKALLGEAG
eukprot:1995544-Rhodomonas_salina.1